MSNRMIGRVQKMKTAVPKKAKSFESPNLQFVIKLNIPQLPAFIITLPNRCILVLQVPRSKSLFEARPNYQRRTLLKSRGTVSVIPMPMTPDNALNTLHINSISFQLLSHSLLDNYFSSSNFDALRDARSEVLVVFSDAKVRREAFTRKSARSGKRRPDRRGV
jgi:hypothetical protein